MTRAGEAGPPPIPTKEAPMTTLSEVMARLEAAGTEQNRKVYRRHGAREPLFGVAFGTLRPLAKQLGRDDALARDLWARGVARDGL